MIRRNPFQRMTILCTALVWVAFASTATAEDVESGTFSLEIWRVSFIGSAAGAKLHFKFEAKRQSVLNEVYESELRDVCHAGVFLAFAVRRWLL
jgi:hypothetical protein